MDGAVPYYQDVSSDAVNLNLKQKEAIYRDGLQNKKPEVGSIS